MPINFFNYVHVFHNLILSVLGGLFLMWFAVFLFLTITRSPKRVGPRRRYMISGVQFITASLVAVSFIKFMHFTPFIFNFLTGSTGFQGSFVLHLFVEYLPKCFGPLALFALITVLLRQTIKELEDKGAFDSFQGYKQFQNFAILAIVACNVALYILAFTAFILDAVALYGALWAQDSMDYSAWFKKGYWVLLAEKSICVLWTFQILGISFWIHFLSIKNRDSLGDLTAAKRLLFLTYCTSIAALFSYALATYGYYDNHWLELVWLGDFGLLIVFFIVWVVVHPLNPISEEGSEERGLDVEEEDRELEGDEVALTNSNTPIDVEEAESSIENQEKLNA